MKLVKLSIFALTMGLFVASCGNGGEAAKTAATTAPVDTMNAGAAKPAEAPATAESKMDKKMDSKMDKKEGKMDKKK